jgi:hypothetical protein
MTLECELVTCNLQHPRGGADCERERDGSFSNLNDLTSEYNRAWRLDRMTFLREGSWLIRVPQSKVWNKLKMKRVKPAMKAEKIYTPHEELILIKQLEQRPRSRDQGVNHWKNVLLITGLNQWKNFRTTVPNAWK